MATSSGEGFALLVCTVVVLILGFFPNVLTPPVKIQDFCFSDVTSF